MNVKIWDLNHEAEAAPRYVVGRIEFDAEVKRLEERNQHLSHEFEREVLLRSALEAKHAFNLRAAVRWKGMVIYSLPRPARHHDIIYKIYELVGETVSLDNGYEQGFVDEKGRWLTREDAFQLTGKGRGGKSFSEDLW